MSAIREIDNILDKYLPEEVHERVFNLIWNVRLLALRRGYSMSKEELEEQEGINKEGVQKW